MATPSIDDESLTKAERLAIFGYTLRQRAGVRSAVDRRFAAPAYHFGATPGSVFGAKPSLNVVVTSIVNILTTAKGSVPYFPGLGSIVPLLLFEILDDITVSLVRYYSYKDVSEQEPRAVVRGVYAERPEGEEHRILVQMGVSLIGDPNGGVYGIPITFDRESLGGI